MTFTEQLMFLARTFPEGKHVSYDEDGNKTEATLMCVVFHADHILTQTQTASGDIIRRLYNTTTEKRA